MRELNPKQLLFVRHYVAGGHTAAQAARMAGYSEQYAKRAAQYLNKNSKLKAAIKEAQADIRDETGLTAQRYLRKLETALAQATEAKQFTAVSSLLQLQGKVAGLLIEKIQVETVDIGTALIEARKRVAVPSLAALIKAKDAEYVELAEPDDGAASDVFE